MSPAKTRKGWLIAAIPIALYLTALFVPFIAPFARYPIYFIKCGGRPVVATDFAAAYTYRVPGSDDYGVDSLVTDFFCTEAEAQSAGFSPSDLPAR